MAARKQKPVEWKPGDPCLGRTARGRRCGYKHGLTAGYCWRHRENDPVKGGAPLTLNDAIRDTIVGYVKAGNYMEVAAAAAGVPKSTFFDWMRRGAKDREAGLVTPVAELSVLVEKAEAFAEARDVTRIAAAGGKNWQALAWRLERKNPRRWGRRDHVTVAGDDEAGPVRVSAEVALGEGTEALAEALLRKAGEAREDTGGV